MARILPFPSQTRRGFQGVQSTYTLTQIHRQFGIPRRYIQRWLDDGILEASPGAREGELVFDIHALAKFRSIRDRKTGGVSLREIDAEMRGQLTLFGHKPGVTLDLVARRSAFEQGLVFFDNGSPEAEDLFERAVAQSDHVADCHCNLGILAYEKGDLNKALDEFSRALAEDPRHMESHFDLANLYFETGDLKLARLHYEAALRIEPEFADACFNLGLLLAELGELSTAAEELRRYCALADDPSAAVELISRIEEVL